MFEYFRLQIGSEKQGYYWFEAELTDGYLKTIRLHCSDGEPEGDAFSKRIWLPWKVTRHMEELAALRVDRWDESYINDRIPDGEEWELFFKTKNRPERRFYGRNAYPRTWEDFMDCIDRMRPGLNIWECTKDWSDYGYE